MFFSPFHLRFPIAGSYSRKTRRLELETTEVQLAYLPEYPDRCQAAEFRIVKIADAGSNAPVDPSYWRMRSLDRMRGDLVVAKLEFDGQKFSRELDRVRDCASGRALYHAILHHGRVELTVEDAASEDRPISNLFVDLRYGARPKRC